MAQILFIKLLALSYLFAYWSLFQQVLGLFGSQGICPIGSLMDSLDKRKRDTFFLKLPTLFWFNHSDTFLRIVAGSGIAFSLLVLFGFPAAPLLFLMWIGYLSFLTLGHPFLSFQWDILLIEVGFIGIFASIQNPWPLLLKFLLFFLLFRFMFSSGIVKLLSKCPEWKSFNAMKYHYETQPIPNRFAYYMHQLPIFAGKCSTILTFVLELVVPFFIFIPDGGRLLAFFLLTVLLLMIALTGNYAYFNLLSFALCVPLVDDKYLSWIPSWMLISPMLPANHVTTVVISIVAAVLLFLNVLQLVSLFYQLGSYHRLLVWIAPFFLVNGYGLFARMTTIRNEIILEGSDDGINWKGYEFKWKPGDLSIPPRQVAPFQPRLDWQLWFASLTHYTYQPWFKAFLLRLLQGSKPVLDLLEHNPFPEKPPKYIRAQFYRYHFTTLKEKRETGNWWKRSYLGLYCPTVERKD